jgi:hypothetical protein
MMKKDQEFIVVPIMHKLIHLTRLFFPNIKIY